MKYLGTFRDNEVCVDYDLYSINARQIKEWLDEKSNITPLKLALFNDDTFAKNDLELLDTEVLKEIDFDIASGKINNPEAFFSKDKGFRYESLKEKANGVQLKEITNKEHQLGYELMPIALIVKDKDLDKREQFYLLDGFRRMYYVNSIPNIDVLVKVYDILTPSQWQTAMLMFNSWKIAQNNNFGLFVDRGYKYGLYTYFGIDLTQYPKESLNYFASYIHKNFYTRLKNNNFAHIDLKLGADLQYEYVSQRTMFYMERKRNKEENSWNYDYIFSCLFAVLGRYRELEYLMNKQETAKELTKEKIEEFLQEKAIAKHVKKILAMTVGGFIENYVEKHLLLDIVNFIGREFGYPEISKDYQNHFNKYTWERYVGMTNEEFEKLKQEEEMRRKSFNQKDILL